MIVPDRFVTDVGPAFRVRPNEVVPLTTVTDPPLSTFSVFRPVPAPAAPPATQIEPLDTFAAVVFAVIAPPVLTLNVIVSLSRSEIRMPSKPWRSDTVPNRFTVPLPTKRMPPLLGLLSRSTVAPGLILSVARVVPLPEPSSTCDEKPRLPPLSLTTVESVPAPMSKVLLPFTQSAEAASVVALPVELL